MKTTIAVVDSLAREAETALADALRERNRQVVSVDEAAWRPGIHGSKEPSSARSSQTFVQSIVAARPRRPASRMVGSGPPERIDAALTSALNQYAALTVPGFTGFKQITFVSASGGTLFIDYIPN